MNSLLTLRSLFCYKAYPEASSNLMPEVIYVLQWNNNINNNDDNSNNNNNNNYYYYYIS